VSVTAYVYMCVWGDVYVCVDGHGGTRSTGTFAALRTHLLTQHQTASITQLKVPRVLKTQTAADFMLAKSL